MRIVLIFLLLFSSYSSIHSIASQDVIVILACDDNPMYKDFWPLIAQAWKQVAGMRPVLAFIAPPESSIDEQCGQVMRFEPLPGISTPLQAQVIRLLLPAYFPDNMCIISDMDMIPLQKNYFMAPIEYFNKEDFIVYRDGATDPRTHLEYAMCYNAAAGKTFAEIFGIENLATDIPQKIKEWHALGLGWGTDQIVLYWYLNHWPARNERLKKLGHPVFGRIDRSDWRYIKDALQKEQYIDAHLLRPYQQYKSEIDQLAHDMGIL